MKPFGVIAIKGNQALWDFGFGEPVLDDDENGFEPVDGLFPVYVDGKQEEVTRRQANQFHPEQRVYLTDSFKEAETLAKHLASVNQGMRYIAFKSESMFYAPPAEVTLARFTEQGLLP